MSVSNEDRDAAVDKIYETPCFNESWLGEWHRPTMGSAMKIVDTLIAHGWGPKPAVDAQRLNDLVTECTLEVALWPLTHYLESKGIEVSGD